jgi:hypothetical protein
MYLDFNLFKKIGIRESKEVQNTKDTITITLQVPVDLLNKDTSVIRKYYIVNNYDRKITLIDTVYNESTGEISFETDKFFVGALVYEDIINTEGDSGYETDIPKTGDIANVCPIMMLLVSFGLVVLSSKLSSRCETGKRS